MARVRTASGRVIFITGFHARRHLQPPDQHAQLDRCFDLSATAVEADHDLARQVRRSGSRLSEEGSKGVRSSVLDAALGEDARRALKGRVAAWTVELKPHRPTIRIGFFHWVYCPDRAQLEQNN